MTAAPTLPTAEELYKRAVTLNLVNSSEASKETFEKIKSGKISLDEYQANFTLDRENAILKTISDMIAQNNELLLKVLSK